MKQSNGEYTTKTGLMESSSHPQACLLAISYYLFVLGHNINAMLRFNALFKCLY